MCCCLLFTLSFGDNDANHWCRFPTHASTKRAAKRTHKTEEHSAIYVKVVKKQEKIIVPKYVMKGYLFTKVTLVLIARQSFSLSLSLSRGCAGDFV